MPDISLLNPAEPATAEAVVALLRVAHAQEAALLHGTGVAPMLAPMLARSEAQVQASRELHLGAFVDDALAGLLCVGPGEAADELAITTLVVHPRAQRQGLARALVATAIARAPGAAWCVNATERNAPALALYAGLGFVQRRRGSLQGADGTVVAMLQLHRAATAG